jgi:hypothetical protein
MDQATQQQAPPQSQGDSQQESQQKTSRRRLWEWTRFGDKGLWDWLELLIVPVALAVVGFLFSVAQESNQQQVEERRVQSQQEIEEQRAQDAALQAYLDEMGSMLIDEDVLRSEEGDEVRTLARARTLTVLERLDPERKGRVLQFLSESDLISKGDPVVNLDKANLEKVSWERASLKDTDLRGAVMNYAYLPSADLRGADLGQRIPNDITISQAKMQEMS